jgi:two-component system, chemotaxis family, chemotaxis protein CheY
MRALVIDDSRAMRMILKGILAEAGFTVIEAASVREGLDRVHALGAVDLALVDWNLPEQLGLAFVEAARADRSMDRMRIMMVTTETEMSQMARALEAGANEYVMKPFTKPTILEKIALMGLTGS